MANEYIGDLTHGASTMAGTEKFEGEDIVPASYYWTADNIGDRLMARRPLGVARRTNSYGIPNTARTNNGSAAGNTITGQLRVYLPFFVDKPITLQGFLAATGNSLPASAPTLIFGVYAWDNANGKPTGALLATASQAAVVISTVYDLTLSSPVVLAPNSYCIAVLMTTAGTPTLVVFSAVPTNDGFQFYSGNVLKHPVCFTGSGGVTTLADPATDVPTAAPSWATGAETNIAALDYPCLLKYTA